MEAAEEGGHRAGRDRRGMVSRQWLLPKLELSLQGAEGRGRLAGASLSQGHTHRHRDTYCLKPTLPTTRP